VGTKHDQREHEAPAATTEPDWAPRRVVSGDSSPNLPEWQEWLIRGFALLTLAYTSYYLFWRWTETLNLDALWFSIPLAMAETYGFIAAILMVITVWRLNRRTPVPAPPDRTVDVFITTYDEPLEILRRTAVGARNITYPHKTYILDDGKRDEVKALAASLGLGYIRRETNEHAKAGNLNHALRETDGEFILQLDADHVPLPHILDRLLGFFNDPKVAFAQSPQDFYNTDSFTHDVSEERRRIWEEQRIFFSLIQPGKDHWNAAFFCGSCGVIRRAALDDIGGFSTETITEDMETSLILHARGWKSAYYGESLAFGLAPASAGAFHVQRLRWGQGSMQILRKFKPLTCKGLSLPQRLCYFSSTSSYLDGFYNMMLYLAPLVFFFTGAFPIRVADREFLIRFVPYLVLSLLMYELLARGTGFIWISARYNMAKFFTYVLAVSGFFARGKLKFNVTPKGPGHVPMKTYAPQLVLMGLSVLAVTWSMTAEPLGLVSYDIPGWGALAYWMNFGWLAINFGLAGYVVQLSLQLQQQRMDHRFADHFPVRVRVRGANGRFRRTAIALTENLNSAGMGLRSTARLEPGERVRVTLPLSTRAVNVAGEVLYRQEVPHTRLKMWLYGIRFQDTPLNVRDAIEMHCVQHAVPIWQLQYRSIVGLFERSTEWIRSGRLEQRRPVRLPANITIVDPADSQAHNGNGARERRVGGKRNGWKLEHLGLLEEISSHGARLILNHPLPPGTRLSYVVPGTDFRGRGETVYATALETSLGVRYAIGIRRPGNEATNDDSDGTLRQVGRRTVRRVEEWIVPSEIDPI
jgi:cellulose synthase (UDP-forming)